MIKVNVAIANISAERFIDVRKPMPPIQISTNINLVNVEKQTDGTLDVPFVLTIVYNPSIAQISLKGNAHVSGEKNEVDKIVEDYESRKPPPAIIVQSISNVVFIESVLISRTLNVPPPIPLPQITEGNQPQAKPKGRDYTS